MTIQIYMGPGLDPFDFKSSLFSSDTSQVLVLSQNIGGQLQVHFVHTYIHMKGSHLDLARICLLYLIKVNTVLILGFLEKVHIIGGTNTDIFRLLWVFEWD